MKKYLLIIITLLTLISCTKYTNKYLIINNISKAHYSIKQKYKLELYYNNHISLYLYTNKKYNIGDTLDFIARK